MAVSRRGGAIESRACHNARVRTMTEHHKCSGVGSLHENDRRLNSKSVRNHDAEVDERRVAGGVFVVAVDAAVADVVPAEAGHESQAAVVDFAGEADAGAGHEVDVGAACGDVAGGQEGAHADVAVDGPLLVVALVEVPAEDDAGVDACFVFTGLAEVPAAGFGGDFDAVVEEPGVCREGLHVGGVVEVVAGAEAEGPCAGAAGGVFDAGLLGFNRGLVGGRTG